MRRWIVVGLLLVAASWALLLWTPDQEQEQLAPVGPETLDQPALLPGSALTVPEPHTPAQPAAVPAAQLADEEQEPTAPAPEEPAPPKPAPTYQLAKLPPPEPQGPVSALKLRFGNESPTEASKLHEQQLTASLQRTGPPPESLENVVCRRSVCRVSWLWKAERVIPFYQAVGALRRDFDPSLGIDAAGPANADAARSIEIYLDVSSSKPQAP